MVNISLSTKASNCSIKYISSYLPEASMGCAEANLFHRGVDLIDGIFFDTGSVRSMEATDQETEDRDIQAHTDVVNFVKNLWRDYTLDREAVVITNVGGSGNCL